MITKLPVLFGIAFALALLFFTIYVSNVTDAAQKKKPLVLYLLAGGILIGLTGILGLFKFTELPIWAFIMAEVWLLIVGIFHVWLFEKAIPLENKNTGKILFTLALCCFGYGLIFLFYKIFLKDPFPRICLLPAFFFVTPVFVMIAFQHFIKIPAKIFKAWDFPPPGTLSDPNDAEMSDPIIVNFEIRKHITDSHTVFKAKAPKDMELGRLFYYFIMDYNSRHSDNPILINHDNQKLFKWSFHTTPGILSGKIHLDPEASISENRIKENSSVTCERITL